VVAPIEDRKRKSNFDDAIHRIELHIEKHSSETAPDETVLGAVETIKIRYKYKKSRVKELSQELEDLIDDHREAVCERDEIKEKYGDFKRDIKMLMRK